MTSPLRRKRRTTAHGRSTPIWKATKLTAALAALLVGGVASAQSQLPTSPKPVPLPSSWAATPNRGGASTAMQAAPMPPPLAPVPPPAPSPITGVQRTAMQVPQADKAAEPDTSSDLQSLLELPGDDAVFGRLEDELAMQLRMQNQAKKNNPTAHKYFPEEPVLAKGKYAGRSWPEMKTYAEPNYVCYHRLLFEQMNLERGGWDLGPVTPVVSAFGFYKDVALLPYHIATDPFRNYECSAGYCAPGDPTPLLLYPPEISATGSFAEAAVIVGLIAIFP